MEFEQLIKRLDWLDQEQRATKQTLSDLQAGAASLQAAVSAAAEQIKELRRQMSEAQTGVKRLDQFDTFLASQRKEINQALDNLEKRLQGQDREAAERLKGELDSIRHAVATGRPASDPEIVRRFKERTDENQRLMVTLNELRHRVEEMAQAGAVAAQGLKSAEDVRAREAKRTTDVQAELLALRKRIDEVREQGILHSDGLRNMEKRLNEVAASEASRAQAQAAFLEGQARSQAERERGWRDWGEKYESLLKQAETLDGQMGAIDETLRAARRAQEIYQDLNTKLERRINEIAEIQRLGEDRLRQEWIAFKTDDQKRWTGHTLAAEESVRDVRRTLERIEARVAGADDTARVLQDQLHQTTATTEQQLRDLMNVVHEWMSSYERIMGHNKKPARKSQ